jgi:hypothetical protein
MAQTASNCTVKSGALVPMTRPASTGAVCGYANSSFYRFDGDWLTWDSVVSVAKSQTAGDAAARIFYTEGGILKSRTAGEVRTVGITAPAKPTVSTAPAFTPTVASVSLLRTLKLVADDQTLYDDTSVGTSGILESFAFDGAKMEMSFRFKPLFGQISKASVVYNASHTVTKGYVLTITGVGNLNLFDNTASLVLKDDSAADYATVKVDSISGDGAPQFTTSYDKGLWGAPTATVYAVSLGEYVLKVVLSMVPVEGQPGTRYVRYVQTLVDDWGFESPPSDPSDIIEFKPGTRITVGGLGGIGNGHITTVRLYRAAAGTEEDAFFYLDEQDSGLSTYVDAKEDAALVEALPVFENPPASLSGVVALPGGFLAAFSGRDVYFSERWRPYSWPEEYRLTLSYDLVALGVSGNDLVALTQGHPFLITGTDPGVMTVTELALDQACVSAQSVCRYGNAVLYASPDGLVGIAGGTGKVLTEGYYARSDWQALSPGTCVAESHDGAIVMSFHGSATTLIFEVALGLITTSSYVFYAVYKDLENDKLYCAYNGAISEWNPAGGTVDAPLVWKSKAFVMARDARFVSLRCRAEGDAQVAVYINGSAVAAASVTTTIAAPEVELDDDLAAGALWEVRVTSYVTVHELLLHGRAVREVDGAARLVANDGVLSWRGLWFRFSRVSSFRVARVRAQTYPVTMTVMAEGGATESYSIANDKDVELTAVSACDLWKVSLDSEAHIDELLLVERVIMPVSGGAVRLTDKSRPLTWRDMRFQFPNVSSFSVARVRAETYPVTLTITPQGGAARPYTVTDDADFVLDDVGSADLWTVSLDSSGYVDELLLVEKKVHTVNNVLRLTPSEVPYSWRSLDFYFPRTGTFVVARLRCEKYPCTLYLYRDGVLVLTQTVWSDADIELASLTAGDLWRVTLSGCGKVDELLLVERQVFPVRGGAIRLADENRPLTWKAMTFQFPNVSSFSVARVRAETYPVTLTITPQGGGSSTYSVGGDSDFVLDHVTSSDTWVVSLDSSGYVDELLLVEKKVHTVNNLLRLTPAEVPFTWRCLDFFFPRTGTFAVARVRAETYPCYLYLFTGVELSDLVLSQTVTSESDIELPSLAASDFWRVTLADAGHVDELLLVERQVFPVRGGAIRLADENRPLTWKAMTFQFPNVSSFVVARVRAETYPVTLTITPQGGAARPYTVTDDADFVLDDVGSADVWTVSLDSSGYVDELLLVETKVRPINGLVRLGPGDAPFSWLGLDFHFARRGALHVGRVRCETYPATLAVYRDGALVETVSVPDDKDFAFAAATSGTTADAWRVSLTGAGEVDELVLMDRTIFRVERGGVLITEANRPYSWRGVQVAMTRAGTFSVLRVRAEDYPFDVTFEAVSGAGSVSVTVTSDADISLTALTALGVDDYWNVTVGADGRVDEFLLIEKEWTPARSNYPLRVQRRPPPFSWLQKAFAYGTRKQFSLGRVRASSYSSVVLKLYTGEEQTLVHTATVTSDAVFRLPKLTPAEKWTFDVITTADVYEVGLGLSPLELQ